MKNLSLWVYVIVAVAIAISANSISTIWAKGEDRFSPWLIAVITISPFVFISFGLVVSKVGMAISSGVIDSLLTFSTIAIGLIVFREWDKVSAAQYVGMAFAMTGIVLMLFFPKMGT